ncbi:helix-turn-helix transcriptional regulator [Oscillospiraceae bacterium HV4-5-C5C]|nr:helix-turn-helix transcriptional regulator [Oscillospiraceae bacterium HV4-5-C5C]
MVEHLSPSAFAAFGEILDERDVPKLFFGIKLQVPAADLAQQKLRLQHISAPLLIARQKGMPLLYLTRTGKSQSIGQLRCFYLDKPVRLNPGVKFALTSLTGPAEILLGQSLNQVGKEAEEVYPGDPCVASDFDPDRLYTLFFQEKDPAFFFAGEQHEPYELLYVTSGFLHQVAGGIDFPLQEGQLMICRPDIWHMQYASGSQPVSFMTISFSLRKPSRLLEDLTQRVLDTDRRTRQCLASMISEQDSQSFAWADVCMNYFREAILRMSRQAYFQEDPLLNQLPPETARENQLVESAQRYINTHLWHHQLRVPDIASAVSISSSYLSSLFRRHLGMSPGKYLNRARLSESRRLLKEGSYSVSEVADLLGFSTLQHFSRCFSQEFGLPPSRYAREYAMPKEGKDSSADIID